MWVAGGGAVAATAVVALRGKLPYLAAFGRAESGNASRAWLSSFLAVPAAGMHSSAN